MGRVKSWIMDQEEKLDEYVWYIVAECETVEEFGNKVLNYMRDNKIQTVGFYKDGSTTRGSLSDVWNEYWSKYNMERG